MPWVDSTKGLSIILVVMMYSACNGGEYTGKVGFLHYIIGSATPFRMPESLLTSGLFPFAGHRSAVAALCRSTNFAELHC